MINGDLRFCLFPDELGSSPLLPQGACSIRSGSEITIYVDILETART